MQIPNFFSRFVLVFLASSLATACFSQSKTNVGLNLTGERTSLSNNVLGFGVVLEKQFSKHSGFETGLYYRTFDQYTRIYIDGSLYDAATIKEHYLSVPIVYKFYSSIVNVSAGPTFDIYTGWKQVGGRFSYSSNPFSVDSKFQVGLLGKVSKTKGITKRFFVEPEFRYNPVFYRGRSYCGFGIAAKYTL